MGVFCDFQVCMTEKDERRTSVCELEFKLRVEFMGEFFFFYSANICECTKNQIQINYWRLTEQLVRILDI